MSEVKAWPLQGPITERLPRPIKRPADYGLEIAIYELEAQLGSVDAYNRLAAAAHALKAKIDAGNGKAQNPIFAVSIRGEAQP